MANIPMGVTLKKKGKSVEDMLTILLGVLDDSEKTSLESQKEQLKASRALSYRLEKDISSREAEANSFGLSSEVINKATKDYTKAIEASSAVYAETSVKVAEDLEDLSNSTSVQRKLSDENKKDLKEIVKQTKEDRRNVLDSSPKKRDSNLSKQVKSSADSLTTSLINSSLGMFGAITQPLESLLGFKVSDMIKGGFSKIFSKKDDKEDAGEYIKKRIRPDKSALKQAGVIGASAVFLGDILGRLLGKKGVSAEGSSLVSGLSGGAASAGVSAIAKLGGVAAIAGGILWGVVDSISAVMKSEEWGVSKVSAAIAGFFSGPGEGGLKDAFKGMGKWALIGAGVGMFAGPVGALVGGLIGGALGGILGFIGGEKTAIAFDAIGAWFSKSWVVVKDFFMAIPEKLTEFWDAVKVKVPELWTSFKAGIATMWEGIKGFFMNIHSFFTVTLPAWASEKYNELKISLSNFFTPAFEAVSGFFTSVKTFFTVDLPSWAVESYTKLVNGVKGIFNFAKDGVLGFFTSIKTFFTKDLPLWASEKVSEVKTAISNFFEIPKNIVIGMFDQIGVDLTSPTLVSDVISSVKTSFLSVFDSIKESILGVLSKLNPKNWFKDSDEVIVSKDSNSSPSIESMDEKKWYQFWKSKENVDDALIYKDGKMYKPSSDDHIIATKTAPMLFNKEGQTVNTGFSSTKESSKETTKEVQTIQSSSPTTSVISFDSMVSLLSSILNVLENKDMSPSYTEVSSPRSLNFDILR